MVDCVVPVSADNPLAYNLVLVSLYLAHSRQAQGLQPSSSLQYARVYTEFSK